MNWKALLVMMIVLAALVLWDTSLREQQTRSRAASARIGSLLSEELLEERPVAAIRVDVGLEVNHLYTYHDGLWRCASAYSVPADHEALQAILPAMLDARGVLRSSDPADAAHFGFDDALRISICGADVYTDPLGDVIFGIDLGRSISATGGSFVRPVGSDDIWEINQNFREIINLRDDIIPPMLDPRIVPQAWPGARLGPTRVVVTAGREPTQQRITITRRERIDVDPTPGMPAWEWIVGDGQSEYVGDLMQVTSYVVFLTRFEYAGILAPRSPQELGLSPPRATVSYVTSEGHELQLHIGASGPRGGVVVFNSVTGNIYEVDPEIASLMLPPFDVLLDAELGNPWQQWMRR